MIVSRKLPSTFTVMMGVSVSKPVADIASSAISILSEDILYLIFFINATDDSNTAHLPLDTTRITSQVCHNWRHILLQSSLIWGKLLDWRSLNQETDHWRNEVLKRSEISPLWVKGYTRRHYRHSSGPTERFDPDVKKSTIVFFHRLLFKHWERIEWLSPFLVSPDLIKRVQTAMLRKAPNLQTFSLPLFYWPDGKSQGTMFSNHAPRLRTFRATDGKCNLDIVWMSSLETLCLGGKFSNKEICGVLAHLPNLKSLELQRHIIIAGYRMPQLHLPNLRRLVLDECIYLRRIISPPGCSLILRVRNQKPIDYFDECRDKIVDTMLHSMSLSLSRFMAIDFQPFFKLRISDRNFPYFNRQEELFDIQLSRGRISLQEMLWPGLLCRLSSPVFSTVTTLLLRWGEGLTDVFESAHALKRFMSFFSCVEKLCISEKDIGPLINHTIDLDEPPLFPNLQTLAVLGNCDPIATELRQFLTWRRNIGAQIVTLDLTMCESVSNASTHRCALDEFQGVKLIWKQDYDEVEYECGKYIVNIL